MMPRTHLALFVAAVSGCTVNGSSGNDPGSHVAIVGGSEQGYDFLRPSTVSLTYEKTDGQHVHLCTGTLVGPNQIVTASHCLVEKLYPERLSVRIVRDGRVETFQPKTFATHPQFAGLWSFDSSHDVALISFDLGEHARFGAFAALDSSPPVVDEGVFLAGYGFTSSSSDSRYGVFNGAAAKISKVNPGSITLPENGVGICGGDSGGPLYRYDEQHGLRLVGVSSSSNECDLGGGDFARIDTNYDWVTCSLARSGGPGCSEMVDGRALVQQNIARCRAYKDGWDLIDDGKAKSTCWPTTEAACNELARTSGGDVHWTDAACQVKD